MDPIILKSSK